jgi:hypothetical protein
MWQRWDPAAFAADCTKIAGMNFNTVRVFVLPDVFGFPQPSTLMQQHLEDALSIANAHGIRLQISLFAIFNAYRRIRASTTWATTLLTPLRGDPRIQSIEIQNELPETNLLALRWARALIDPVRAAGGTIPVVISPTAHVEDLRTLRAALIGDEPDFYSFHFYGSIDSVIPTLRAAEEVVGSGRFVVGETGFPSGNGPPGAPIDPAKELEEKRFIQRIELATERLGLPPAGIWIYQDLVPDKLDPHTPLRAYHFGMLRADGSEKPVAPWIRAYFAARR